MLYFRTFGIEPRANSSTLEGKPERIYGTSQQQQLGQHLKTVRLPVTAFIEVLTVTQTSSHVVLFPISIYILTAAQGLQLRFFGFLFFHWLHIAL